MAAIGPFGGPPGLPELVAQLKAKVDQLEAELEFAAALVDSLMELSGDLAVENSSLLHNLQVREFSNN